MPPGEVPIGPRGDRLMANALPGSYVKCSRVWTDVIGLECATVSTQRPFVNRKTALRCMKKGDLR